MEINDMMHGFRLLKKQFLKETASEAFEFVHEKSGAKLFYLKNNDDNKVFFIGFRTPPADDTGVAHIIEHSVLCGSKKYPLKEPFVELVKGSLNTFLNAMTYPDKTIYPMASRNDKDFQNLMDVYLDAVFFPSIYNTKEILMQEGWHYEINQPEDELRYSGVVYNEMKGALSDTEQLLSSRVMASLYPDTTYSCESGGDPAKIPTLTQEMFVDFHKRYYHPSNSYIYLYGDMDLEEKLSYLDREYLSKFDVMEVSSEIQLQKPFSKERHVTEAYPCAMDESTEEKTFLTINYVLGNVLNEEDMLGLEILERVLFDTPASPVRRALLDAELGKDVDSVFESEILQPFLSIILNNSEKDRMEQFCDIVDETLKRLVRDGIDQKLMESSINLLEFRLREADFGSAPKGLIYGIRSLKTWLYDGDPVTYLAYEDLLKKMKDGLSNGFFERLIQKYLLDNPHKVLLVMEPSKTLAIEKEQALKEELAAKKEKLSQEEIRELIELNRQLKERQQRPESLEALKTIPLLKLSDIRKDSEDYPLEERLLEDTKIFFSNLETNGIAYLNFVFDTSCVPQEKLPYLHLFSELIGSVSTENYSYEELGKEIDLYTGGISYLATAVTKKNNAEDFRPVFKVKAKSLIGKLPKLMELLAEIFTKTCFDDKKRVKEIITQVRVAFELNMQRSAHNIVSCRLESYLSSSGSYMEEGGLPFYRFIKSFLADFDRRFEELPSIMKEILSLVFRKENMLIGITMPKQEYQSFAAAVPSLLSRLPNESCSKEAYHWSHDVKNEGFMSTSQVQYVGKGANFIKLGYPYTGVMRILETLLKYDYFWTKIRVQGGAYGAFTHFNRNGMMYFASYRDPNLVETLDILNKTADYLKSFQVSDREMDKLIIGTMSNIDAPLTPKMKGEAAFDCWLRNITLEDRQKSRDEILTARQQEIRDLADLIDSCMKEDYLCVFGNEAKLKENKECFSSLVSVME